MHSKSLRSIPRRIPSNERLFRQIDHAIFDRLSIFSSFVKILLSNRRLRNYEFKRHGNTKIPFCFLVSLMHPLVYCLSPFKLPFKLFLFFFIATLPFSLRFVALIGIYFLYRLSIFQLRTIK